MMLENSVNIREGIGIGNEFLKIARRVEPLIGSGDIRSLISYYLMIFSAIDE